MSNSKEIQEQVNKLSAHLTTIDSELAALEALGPKGDGAKMYPHSVKAHEELGEASLALDDIAGLVQEDIDGEDDGDEGNPPGTGDVGGAPVKGTGPIPPAALTKGNWNYYAQHALGPQWADIFSGTLDEVNAAMGSDAGAIATAPEDPVVPGGYPPYPSLATWG